jgi:uncharacterized protein (TIGR03000 family)
MLRKCFLVPMLASVALFAVTVDVAQAQMLRGRTVRMERRDVRRGIVTTPTVVTTTPGMPIGLTPTVMTTTSARISYYPTPVNQNLGDSAQIRVILPDAQAKVFFDNRATTSMGNDRLFVTPALPAGTPNSYVVRCTWMQNGQEVTREQALSCTANTTYVVDFTARR